MARRKVTEASAIEFFEKEIDRIEKLQGKEGKHLPRMELLLIYDMVVEALKAEKLDWIPCSEQLPKKNGTYLVTEDVYSSDKHVNKFLYTKVEMVEFSGGEWRRASFYKIIAWAEPKPYVPK